MTAIPLQTEQPVETILSREEAVAKYFRKTPKEPIEVKNRGLKSGIGFICIIIATILHFNTEPESEVWITNTIIYIILIGIGGYYLWIAGILDIAKTLQSLYTSSPVRNYGDQISENLRGYALGFIGSIFIFIVSTIFSHGTLLFLSIIGLVTFFFFIDRVYKKVHQLAFDLAEPKPSDEQMDLWRDEGIKLVQNNSLSKLDLLPEQLFSDPDRPITIIGPANNARIAKGQDQIIRASYYDILTIHLTDYHLATYQCIYSVAKGTLVSESTQEYHYNDVVGVSTQTANNGFGVTIDDEKQSIESYQKFALHVSGGQQIQVAIAFNHYDEEKESTPSGELPLTGAERAIRIIRSRLREKKGGTN